MKYESEYHTEYELEQIANWETKNAYSLIENLRDMWEYKDYIIENWGTDQIYKDRPILILELHTGGWSGNEDIIAALKNHKLFWMMWWWKTERGGHYYFKVDFYQIGFKKVSEYIRENKVSRQYIYKSNHKFDWIEISQNKRLIRKKLMKVKPNPEDIIK